MTAAHGWHGIFRYDNHGRLSFERAAGDEEVARRLMMILIIIPYIMVELCERMAQLRMCHGGGQIVIDSLDVPATETESAGRLR